MPCIFVLKVNNVQVNLCNLDFGLPEVRKISSQWYDLHLYGGEFLQFQHLCNLGQDVLQPILLWSLRRQSGYITICITKFPTVMCRPLVLTRIFSSVVTVEFPWITCYHTQWWVQWRIFPWNFRRWAIQPKMNVLSKSNPWLSPFWRINRANSLRCFSRSRRPSAAAPCPSVWLLLSGASSRILLSLPGAAGQSAPEINPIIKSEISVKNKWINGFSLKLNHF